MGPFLFEYRHQHKVQLVQERSLGLEASFGLGVLDDETDNEVANAWSMLEVDQNVVYFQYTYPGTAPEEEPSILS